MNVISRMLFWVDTAGRVRVSLTWQNGDGRLLNNDFAFEDLKQAYSAGKEFNSTLTAAMRTNDARKRHGNDKAD